MFIEVILDQNQPTRSTRTVRVQEWATALKLMGASMRKLIPAAKLAVDPTTRGLVEQYEAGRGEPIGNWCVFACGDFAVAAWLKNDDGTHLTDEQRRARERERMK